MPSIAIYARKSTESEDRQILSIDSQVKELKEHAVREGLEVSRIFFESKSAKAPGRPVFNELFKSVQEGRIDGVLCWKLDRLARNPVDGGAVIWAMEERKLAAIYTPQRSFTNTSNDKFWMQLEFGMAKKYVDDLSDNVKRGLRAKLAAGWMPGMPPLGYLNDRNERTIIKDPERFSLVRRMWDLMLTSNYTPPQVLAIATRQWGLLTRAFRRIGGRPLARSAVYALFRNPFYYGAVVRRGEFFHGRHPPMVRKAEFDRVQRLLNSMSNPRPQKRTFAYTGLIRCGECGASVTAERKVNRQGHEYVYYHCTKRKSGTTCSQGVVQVQDLERQITAFLNSVTIPHPIAEWARNRVAEHQNEDQEQERAALESLKHRLAGCERELKELVNLRLRSLLTDEEYVTKKRELESEKCDVRESLQHSHGKSADATHAASDIFRFAETALELFTNGPQEVKRAIVQFTGSNLSLRDRILTILPQKPLVLLQRTARLKSPERSPFEPPNFGSTERQIGLGPVDKPTWCTLVDDVRIFFQQNRSVHTFKETLYLVRQELAEKATKRHLSAARRRVTVHQYGACPGRARSPESPARRTRAADRSVPSPSGTTFGSSSQSGRRALVGLGGARHGSG